MMFSNTNNKHNMKYINLGFVAAFILLAINISLGFAEPPKYPRKAANVITGQSLYPNYCADCHGDDAKGGSQSRLDFTNPDWSASYSPVEIVEIALGTSNGHQATLKDVGKSWDIMAYLWTLPLSSNIIKTGQSEVEKAAELMKKGGIAFLITKGGEIKELESVDWVMQHKKADIIKLIKDLASDQYNALNQEHQEALIDYIYASHFKLPKGW